MTTFELWKKIIRTKTYTKEIALKRVTIMAVMFTDEEFAELLELIEITYK